ncbi:WXG100 family type VII secretion target [Frondihabitans cladoniiphilus]|uniref:ESAT-6-like protein n=1 Tax=Frondihabitans cladoniiphilus TaxID=715785 RepID=A0ABP8VP34_9MICO
MADFEVSSEAVHGASARVADMVDEFDARHASANQTVSALVGGSWSGPGSEAFQKGWVEWSDGAAKVSRALEGISRLLAEASIQYEATEAGVTRESTSSSVVSAPASQSAATSNGGAR